jgi:hypothetical protein
LNGRNSLMKTSWIIVSLADPPSLQRSRPDRTWNLPSLFFTIQSLLRLKRNPLLLLLW